MIKANELRLNNYVYNWYSGEYHEWKLNINDLTEILENNNHDYKPIPLTEEWLVKIGFIVSEDTNSHNLKKAIIDGFRVNTYFDEEIRYWWLGYYHNKKNAQIKYVHQLQNIYFCLTGEELTIKQ